MNGCDPRRIANRVTFLAFVLAAACGGAPDPSDAGASSATAPLTTPGQGGSPGNSGNAGAPGWFALQATPGLVELEADGTASAKVTVARGGGFTGAVNLSAELLGGGLPVDVAFEPASVTTSEATMVITLAAQPAAGAWPAQMQVIIRGKSGGATGTAFVTVSAATPWGSSSGSTSSSGATASGSGGASLSATPGSNVTGCASLGPGDVSLGTLLAGLGLARGAARCRRRGPRSRRS
jgi:hypothetical protein